MFKKDIVSDNLVKKIILLIFYSMFHIDVIREDDNIYHEDYMENDFEDVEDRVNYDNLIYENSMDIDKDC